MLLHYITPWYYLYLIKLHCLVICISVI
jgi:hypothetical protein